MSNLSNEERAFLKQSNYIENERSRQGYRDSVKAWIYAKENFEKIDIEYLLRIHFLLAKNLRPDIAGKFRTCDVWIGGILKRFIATGLFVEELEYIIRLIKSYKNITPDLADEFCQNIHVRFGWCATKKFGG